MRLIPSLLELADKSSERVTAPVLHSAFQLSGARPEALLSQLLDDSPALVAEAVQSASNRDSKGAHADKSHVTAALTCVTAGAVLLHSAALDSSSGADVQALTQRFTEHLCLPLLQSTPLDSNHMRSVAGALATAVVDTNAWSTSAQLLSNCVATWRRAQHSALGMSLPASSDEDGEHAGLTPEVACMLASAVLEELNSRKISVATAGMPAPDILHAALSTLGGESSSAALDAAFVRDVIPVAVDLCLAESDSGSYAAVRDAATSLLLSSSRLAAHRAAMALLVRFADTPVVSELPWQSDGGSDSLFWKALRGCLWRPDDARLRKQALHILRCSLGPERCAAGGWSSFCTVLDIVEDYSMHLVTPAFQRLRLLHPTGSDNPPPADVPLQWIAVIWCKAVTHENPTFRRQALAALAESEWSGSYAHMLPESALFGPLLNAVNDPINHKDGEEPSVAAAGVAAAAAARVRSAGEHRPERVQAVNRVLQAICDLDSPSRPGLAAMISIARAACLACTTKCTITDVGSPTHADQSLELLRRLAVLATEQWGSSYRAQAASMLLDAASAAAPAGCVSIAAAGRFLDALTRSGGLVGGGPSYEQLRDNACRWLAGTPSNAAWLSQALDESRYKRGSSTDNDVESTVFCTMEELTGWASDARQAAMLWSLLPDAAHKQTLASRLQADASGVYTRAHAPEGWTMRVLLLLEAIAKAANRPSDDTIMHVVAASCVAEVAALARTALVGGLCAPVSAESPLGAFNRPMVERCNSSVGGPPSVLSPARLAAGHQACAALAALAALSRWRPNVELVHTNPSWADAWRQCDADLIRLLECVVATTTNTNVVDGDANAAAEMLDTAAACTSLAVDALIADADMTPRCSAELAREAFASVAHIATVHPAKRTAGGLPAFMFGPQASAAGGMSTCVGARMRAISCAARLPGACAPVTRAHADALGGAIAACAVVARGDSADVFRATRTLLPVLVASVRDDGGVLVQAAADAAARTARDDDLLVQDVFEEEPSGPLDDSMLSEPLAPLARALCRCMWLGLSDSPNRPMKVLAECLAAALHPALFAIECLHAPRTGPLRAFVRNLLTVSEQSGRLMRVAAAAVWAQWLQYPHLIASAQYDREMARINLFSVADHDADYSEDLLDPSAAAALRACPGGMDAASFGALAGEALAVRVTGVCAAHELARRGHEDGDGAAKSAARALMKRLLTAVVSDPELSAEVYRKNSVTHRRKVRAWQMLAALAPVLPMEGSADSEEVALLQLLERSFVFTLDMLNLPSVKQYEEAFFTAMLLRAPSFVHSHVVPALDVKQAAARPYTIASLVLIAHAYVRHEHDIAAQRSTLPAVLAAVTPWACTHNHSLRTFAQTVLFELFFAFPAVHPAWTDSSDASGGDAFSGTGGAVLASLRTFFIDNDDCVKTRQATGRVGSMHPSVACTPAVIFGRGPDCPFEVGARFEGAPTPLVERIAAFLDGLRVDTRKARVATEGTLLLQSQQSDGSTQLAATATGRGGAAADALQKKVDPATASFVDVALGAGDDPLDGGRVSRRVQLPRRQDLILCASLVEKPTNLGGLARTAEVFLLQRLVIGDLSVVQNPVFKGMAVTAERHVPISAVPAQALPSYLAAKRAEGYSLVGLEQTTGSVPLTGYAFPQRCVLLLGSEGLGIPAELLPLLDACVEIEQPGKKVRSLNVHVSASLAIYCYSSQWHAGV